MQIAMLLYDRFTALDIVGPYEVLSRLPGAQTTFVAAQPGPITNDSRSFVLEAQDALSEVSAPDIIVVPGGPGQRALMADGELHRWLREVHEHTTWTTSVCTGSLLLAAAGLLDGRRATSHWLALEELAALGALVTPERVVRDGKLMSAAGVSAGIDMALALAAELAGPEVAQAIQLGIEYDPQPPFDAGSPSSAPAAIVDAMRANSRFVLEGA
jgi:putative intracellular protease/amidase